MGKINYLILKIICQHYCNIKGKATDAVNEQLKLVYNECLAHGKALVVLDNFDFLLENVNSETDPNAKLYSHQLVESKKNQINFIE